MQDFYLYYSLQLTMLYAYFTLSEGSKVTLIIMMIVVLEFHNTQNANTEALVNVYLKLV